MDFDPEHQRFGSIISQRRQQQDLSQAALAKKIGKTAGYVGQLEGGSRPPTKAVCTKIATALGLPEERLWLHAAWGRVGSDERMALLAHLQRKPSSKPTIPTRELSMALTSLEGAEAWGGITVQLTKLIGRLSGIQFYAGMVRGPFGQSRPSMLGQELAEALRLAADLPDAVLAELIAAVAGMARSAAAFGSVWPTEPENTFFSRHRK